MKTPHFTCDLTSPAEPFPHFWEHTVGSGHATLALRADWQKQLERCHRELGFRYVRFHGLLSDDMSTFQIVEDKPLYSFHNADLIGDFLLSIGMKPFVELSFMPEALASGKKTVFHYQSNVTPPKDYSAWKALIHRLVQHWSDRYGAEEVKQWFFEVWNEPNLNAFWPGTKKDYFKLYDVSAQAIKEVHPEFRVGGPATADNEWIREFVHHCQSSDSPVDFVSTHHYPTDAFGKPGDDTIAQLAASHRGVLREKTAVVKKEAGELPVYYTEWASSSNPFDELHDLPYAAAFIAKTVMEARGLVEGYSYWTFSDIFEENYFSSVPFHGGFGLLTIHGIPKPAYRAYELLRRLGDEILTVKGHHETVDTWVTRDRERVSILVSNSNLPRHPIKTEEVTLRLRGLTSIKSATLERIDETHANAYEAWKKMGRPEYLRAEDIRSLEDASRLIAEPIEFQRADGVGELSFSIPPHGTVLITLS